MKIFSYRLAIDSGAAPNPFWGYCTLAICKPAIRRVASVGDWIVGTGSAASPIGDVSTSVVYAMRVDKIMTMREYDEFTKSALPAKIPVWGHRDARRRLGDSIYDFTSNPPKLRRSVHEEKDRNRDLSGENVLVSERFLYFGDSPVPLPRDLHPIIKNGPGHKSEANAPYIQRFLAWIESLALTPNQLHGNPQYFLFPPSCYPGRTRTKRC